ncbi:MAG: orotidine-5'-phosphate decarboxylase [Armatimonadota bacterium]|nr:orotidine-5'-phosphate decarboxylase [Armatimonadota bacterium]MDW8156049.1 orotidine-5'-phosphate decarboxylase [Armatimonadota bacterium]
MAELIVALDVADLEAAKRLLDQLRPVVCNFKVGSQLFTAAGPQAVREVHARGGRVFLDLKFHDIPNTVEQAAAAAARLGVWMLNVHACGGLEMMRRAAQGARRASEAPPVVLGVTALTSADEATLQQVGVREPPQAYTLRLARLARQAGMDGVVCSVHEVASVKEVCGPDFLTVVPGVRPREVSGDDQARTGGLREAVQTGADYVVVGRPILLSPDPAAAARTTVEALEALRSRLGR